jgi:hypothetical protein
MTALLLDAMEQDRIKAAVARARSRPIPWSALQGFAVADPGPTLALADRPEGFKRPPSEHVIVPCGYRVAISFEEQPAGLCRHVSISIEDADPRYPLPNPHAVAMIASACGFKSWPPNPGRMWREEFAPGQWAINVLEVDEPAPDLPTQGKA